MIVFALIGIALAMFVASAGWRWWDPQLDLGPLYGLGAFLGVAIWFVASAGLSITSAWSDSGPSGECWRFPIVASGDNTLTGGSFGIFGGSIDEEPVYFFYRKNGPVIRQGNIPTNITGIYQDTELGKEYISVHKTDANCDPEWSGDTVWWRQPVVFWTGVKTYQIHVDDGSVVEIHRFDLE